MPSAFTCSLCTGPGASPARIAAVCFPCAFSVNDTTHAPRRWRTSPEFPGLREQLPAGAPLNHPLFPQLWLSPQYLVKKVFPDIWQEW